MKGKYKRRSTVLPTGIALPQQSYESPTAQQQDSGTTEQGDTQHTSTERAEPIEPIGKTRWTTQERPHTRRAQARAAKMTPADQRETPRKQAPELPRYINTEPELAMTNEGQRSVFGALSARIWLGERATSLRFAGTYYYTSPVLEDALEDARRQGQRNLLISLEGAIATETGLWMTDDFFESIEWLEIWKPARPGVMQTRSEAFSQGIDTDENGMPTDTGAPLPKRVAQAGGLREMLKEMRSEATRALDAQRAVSAP